MTIIYNIGPKSQNTNDCPALFYCRKICYGVCIWKLFLTLHRKKRQTFQHLELLERYNYGDNIVYHLNRDTSLNEYNYL